MFTPDDIFAIHRVYTPSGMPTVVEFPVLQFVNYVNIATHATMQYHRVKLRALTYLYKLAVTLNVLQYCGDEYLLNQHKHTHMLVKSLAAPTHVHSCVQEVGYSKYGAQKSRLWRFHLLGVGKMSISELEWGDRYWRP